jgi:hypothetical protein
MVILMEADEVDLSALDEGVRAGATAAGGRIAAQTARSTRQFYESEMERLAGDRAGQAGVIAAAADDGIDVGPLPSWWSSTRIRFKRAAALG